MEGVGCNETIEPALIADALSTVPAVTTPFLVGESHDFHALSG